MDQIQKYAKTIVALLGALLTAGSTFIPADWQPYLSFALAIVTAVATYQVPNKGNPADVLVQGDGLSDGDNTPPKHAA